MKWKKISQKHGIKYVSEVFSDRNYNDNLTLVNRNNENSMITDINDSIIHLSRMINKGKVKTVNNKLIDIPLIELPLVAEATILLLLLNSILPLFKALHPGCKKNGKFSSASVIRANISLATAP